MSAGPLNVTVTPGRTAPVKSVTLPNTSPMLTCASAVAALAGSMRHTSTTARRSAPLIHSPEKPTTCKKNGRPLTLRDTAYGCVGRESRALSHNPCVRFKILVAAVLIAAATATPCEKKAADRPDPPDRNVLLVRIATVRGDAHR